MKYFPHDYQRYCIERLLREPALGLFLDMGLGKTVVTLTAANELLYDRFEVSRVLIIAPKKVAEATWQAEAAKWTHLRHLRFSSILGTEQQRLRAVYAQADVYIVNRENVVWLVERLHGGLGGSRPRHARGQGRMLLEADGMPPQDIGRQGVTERSLRSEV